MAVRRILQVGDPGWEMLHQPVYYHTMDVADTWRESLLQDLVDTLKSIPNALGLSAPQIGTPLPAIALRLSLEDTAFVDTAIHLDTMEALLCPRITAVSHTMLWEYEGCLSIPGILVAVSRPEYILLDGTAQNGLPFKAVLLGRTARVAQHEMDHLEGRLITDYVTLPPPRGWSATNRT